MIFMREELIKLMDKSYAPYSNFYVSCLIEMIDGKFIPGVNVENASYGASICAERNAITTAIAMGYKKGDFKEINIMVSSGEIGMPCFVCRQMFVELFDKDVVIRCFATDGRYKEFSMDEVCPYPFSSEDLI